MRKKYSCLRAKARTKAVSEREVQNKRTAKTFAQFRRVNNRTGGGPGIDPPDEDGEAEPHEDLLPMDVEDILKVSLPPSSRTTSASEHAGADHQRKETFKFCLILFIEKINDIIVIAILYHCC